MVYRKIISTFLILFFVFLFSPSADAAGATLNITPVSGQMNVGGTINSNIFVHCGGNPVNSAEATINFDPQHLNVVSISKAGSIFQFWPVEPNFDNARGIISFAGGTTSSFCGSNGVILNIVFAGKNPGEAILGFSGARILAADGSGTNVFGGAQGATWSVLGATPAPQSANVPSRPSVSSTTHANSNNWYANKDPSFRWVIPSGVDGVNILADRNPNTNPGTSSDGLFNSHTYEDVDEGQWYFHIRFRNSAGWGGVTHFGFKIDTEKPNKFKINKEEVSNGTVYFYFDSEDKTSGVEKYLVKVDDGNFVEWIDPGDHIYELDRLDPGPHTIVARAVDAAGNFLETSYDFDTSPYGEEEVVISRTMAYVYIAVLGGLVAIIIYLLLRLSNNRPRRRKTKK